MKSVALFGLALAAASAGPVWAQTSEGTGWYGSLGYSAEWKDQAVMGAVSGRLGNRLTRYLGVEGELKAGTGGEAAQGLGEGVRERLNHEAAAYAVGFLPVTPKLDLIARLGYGVSRYGIEDDAGWARQRRESVNFGVGAQYQLNPANGVRLDYTRKAFTSSDLHANEVGVSFVHRF